MQEPKKYSPYPQQENNIVQELLSKYLPYWPLFALMVILSLGAAYGYLRYKIPVYQASATILIKDENKGMWNESDIMQSLNMFGANKIVENEIEVIKSRNLARQVVKKLRLYAPITEEGNIQSRSAYTISPILVEAKNPDSLIETEKVFFTYNRSRNKIHVNGKDYDLNSWQQTPFGELLFSENWNYTDGDLTDIESNKPLYFSLVDVKSVAGSLVNNLNVAATSKLSSVINLELKDEVPKRAEDILNELISQYDKAAISDKNILASNTLQFVEDRLHFVVQELDSVESQLERFRTKNKIVDISSQGKLFLENVGENDRKVTELNMQLAVLNQVESYVVSKNNKSGIVPSSLGIGDPVLTQLLQRLYEAEMQYEKLKQTTAENNPMMTGLADQIEKMRPSVLENIRSQRRNMQAGRSDVAATNSKFSSMLSALPQKERELLDISRQQAIKNNIYTFLLQKREETALSFASTVADSRLVDSAQSSDSPVSPNRKMIYMMGIIAAIGAVIAFITIKEVLSRNVLFRSEIEKLTSVPILGEIIHDSSKSKVVISEGKRTVIAEQFRHLRTSLGYLGINNRKKKILVTSTMSGEGKSFVCANLGISLSLMGKRVVAVELDLRKPKLSDALSIPRNVGLTNFLIGERDVEHIIKPTAHANLFLIPSGPVPPNPSELIVNGRLEELFIYLEQNFDYIIIDTAPISPVTDAFILSPMCDATLFVVRHGITPRSFVQKLDEQINSHEMKNIAIVFNGIKERGFGNYGYGYGGAYGSGYGYGYTSTDVAEVKKKEQVG